MSDPTGVLRGLLPAATPPADGVYPRVSVAAISLNLGAISGMAVTPSQQPAGQVTLAPALVATPSSSAISTGIPASGHRGAPGVVPSAR